ncbi:MAG: hypothetical protein G01um101438_370 [Parcubacteria group bacterium Gr01-1014_38]|nr:MAG: hypothetical protein G01um101438_370 [Parcubacteria group bacterium Gr01-1014_38]
MTTLDVVNQLLTVVLALAVCLLTFGVLAVGSRLSGRTSPRSLLRRAVVVTLQDPRVVFARHAARNTKTQEILVPFSRYLGAARLLLFGFSVTVLLLAVKLALVFLRLGIAFPYRISGG